MTNIGIVGSRMRKDRDVVIQVVNLLPKDSVIVSGGCRGVDTWAEEQAKKRGLGILIFNPNLTNVKGKIDMINRYYERNRKIAENSQILFAFVSNDRKGGTENTIKWAEKLNVPVLIIDEKRE